MKSIIKYINESNNFDDACECLEYIVNVSKSKPDIWDDSEIWDAKDDFEYWQDAAGSWDDIIEFIDKYASDKCVAGWKTEKSFEETEKLLPNLIKKIINKKPEILYKKNSNMMELWNSIYEGYNVNVLRFKNYKNNNGTDYVEYWIMITIEK